MNRKVKYLLTIIMALIIMAPFSVKLVDLTFHHHYYFNITKGQDNILHIYHQPCPIPSMQLPFYTQAKSIHTTIKINFIEYFLLFNNRKYFSNEIDFSSLLRAPPLSNNIFSLT